MFHWYRRFPSGLTVTVAVFLAFFIVVPHSWWIVVRRGA